MKRKEKRAKFEISMGSNFELVRTLESMLRISLGKSVSDSILVIATTSFAVIIGILVLVWKRSSDQSSRQVTPMVAPKFSSLKVEDDEAEVDSGKTKVSIFFGTQNGTAEGFAKVICLCCCCCIKNIFSFRLCVFCLGLC